MKRQLISHHRLLNQQIYKPKFEKAEDVVKWMGAVQAQDYLGSLWAVALRTKKQTEPEVEKALANKSIVRSWPMRGTLHFVPPQDLRWMLKYLTARPMARAVTQHKQMGLTVKDFIKSRKVLEKIMQGHQFTRNEIYDSLTQAKISCEGQRGMHIIVQLAQEGLICCASRRGKQHTFALVDEWLPPVAMINKEEALHHFAKSYFASHGPATLHDFAWWTGLSLTDALQAVGSVESILEKQIINGITYWTVPNVKVSKSDQFYLLPAYDEFLIAYKERSASIEEKYSTDFPGEKAIFNSIAVYNGKVIGNWKRELFKDRVNLEISLSQKVNKEVIAKEAKRYGRFLGLETTIKVK